MLGTKNPFILDRRVYAFKGKWKNPQNDHLENIYYFVSTPLTLATTWENGREEIRPTISITTFGEHAFCEHDIFYLQDGTKFEIGDITNNYFEPNIQVRDMLKPRIENQELTLK